MNCKSPLQWEGLYEGLDNWKKMVTPESFVHPAKMAPRLCEKIFEHLEELKMIEQDSTVVDFMAGTGTTNIIASMRGYSSVSIELEPRFVKIEAGNRKRLEGYLGSEPKWRIIQGDSRKLSKMLNNGGASVVSPPYRDVLRGSTKAFGENVDQSKMKRPDVFTSKTNISGKGAFGGYSPNSLKNVGNLVSVMSPSYGGSEQTDKRWSNPNPNAKNSLIDKDKKSTYLHPKNVGVLSPPYQNVNAPENPDQSYTNVWKMRGDRKEKGLHVLSGKSLRYNVNNPKNVGNLASVVSPPYQDAISSPRSKNRAGRLIKSGRDPKSYMGGTGKQLDTEIRYSKSKTNIGNLKTGRAGVTSPPYFKSGDPNVKGTPTLNIRGRRAFLNVYGQHESNIGNESQETYESAMLQIYQEAHRAGISPLVTVTKNPTRKGSLVRLDLITADLLQKSGYQIFDYHQAVLFKSHDESSMNLDGQIEESVSHKGRIGFFKQLSLKKGNVAASWEDVIFAV